MPSSHRPLTVALLTSMLVLAACTGGDPPAAEPPPVVEVEPDTAEPQDDGGIEAPEPPDDEDGPDEVEPNPEPVVEPDLSVELRLTEVASLSSPTAGAVGPDGTLFVATRGGTVHPLTDDGVGGAVVDIASTTTTDGERGLLGLAFAADGSELYLSSTDREGDTIIAGVPVVDGTPDGDIRTIYTLEQPFSNHNGGNIAIGPDGMLYLGLGDGGRAGDPLEAGQDLTTPLGAMLRIDPQGGDPYAVPSDNPFLDIDSAAPEIVAYGLRNPWRFSFDRATGDVWIADVGQNSREEINRVTLAELSGANFGWNLMEGTLEFAGSAPDDHVPPVYEYDTGGPEGCSVTGGYVYRGQAIPELTGVYLYADVCNGTIRGLLVDDDGEVVEQAELGIGGGTVVSFAHDAEGELYVFDLDGRILRIEAA